MLLLIFLLFCAPADAQSLEKVHGLPEGLLAKIESAESRTGIGTKFAVDVANEFQSAALYEIARRIGRPAHRIRSNYAGCIGVMQFKPATFLQFARYGADPEDPRDSRETAARYLGWLVKRYGLKRALQKYSGNAKYVQKIMEEL